jgi:hypothetical protein
MRSQHRLDDGREIIHATRARRRFVFIIPPRLLHHPVGVIRSFRDLRVERRRRRRGGGGGDDRSKLEVEYAEPSVVAARGGDMPLLLLDDEGRPHLANGTSHRLAPPPPPRPTSCVEVSIVVIILLLLLL